MTIARKLSLALVGLTVLSDSGAARRERAAASELAADGFLEHAQARPTGEVGRGGQASTAFQPTALLQSKGGSWLGIRASAAGDGLRILPVTFDEYVVWASACVAALVLFLSFLSVNTQAMSKRAAVQEQLEGLERSYATYVHDLSGQLQLCQESGAHLAESNFEGKSRSFRHFLQDVAKSPQSFSGDLPASELLEPLRQYARHWLRVFAHCTARPRRLPLEIMRESELSACRTAPELAGQLVGKLDSCTVSLLGREIERAEALMRLSPPPPEDADGAGEGGKERQRAEPPPARQLSCTWLRCEPCGFGCSSTSIYGGVFPMELRAGLVSVTLLSSRHVYFLAGSLKCMLLCMMEVSLSKPCFAGLALIGAGCFMLAALRVEYADSIVAVERQVETLQRASEEVAGVKEVLLSYHKHATEILSLWNNQTVPRLEHLEELFERMQDTVDDGHRRLDYLKACNACLDAVERGMGPVSAWIGPKACSEDVLMLGCRQFRAHMQSITEPRRGLGHTEEFLEHLRRPMFGLLVVKILAGHSLRNADFSITGTNKSDPYVELTVGEAKFKTETIDDDLNPVWSTQPYVFELVPTDSTLELHVWDEDWGSSDSLGLLRVDIRCGDLERGRWQRRRERLRDEKTGELEDTGELEYEIYYTDEVPQMDWQAAPPAATS